MSKKPSFQFYPGDWMKDPELRSISVAARGLWIDMLCLMFESRERGFLLINGKAPSEVQLARMVGCTGEELSHCLSELKDAGVLSLNGTHVMFSRRMVRDAEISNKRAKCGKLGGNPNLLNQNSSKTEANGNQSSNQNPTPSSSSSITIKKETREDFIKVSGQLFLGKPSDYINQHLVSATDQIMMTVLSGIEKINVLNKLDEDYGFHEFRDEMHLRNSFKSVGKTLKPVKEKTFKKGAVVDQSQNKNLFA
jgi:hypothetical protein